MVGFLLVTLGGLLIGTGEGYLIDLSLGVSLGPPLKSRNLGAVTPGIDGNYPFSVTVFFGKSTLLYFEVILIVILHYFIIQIYHKS